MPDYECADLVAIHVAVIALGCRSPAQGSLAHIMEWQAQPSLYAGGYCGVHRRARRFFQLVTGRPSSRAGVSQGGSPAMWIFPGVRLQAVLAIEFSRLLPPAGDRIEADEAEALGREVIETLKPASSADRNESRRRWNRRSCPHQPEMLRRLVLSVFVSEIAHWFSSPAFGHENKIGTNASGSPAVRICGPFWNGP